MYGETFYNPVLSGFLYTHTVIFRNSPWRESIFYLDFLVEIKPNTDFTSQHLHSRERCTSCEKRPQFYSYLM